MSQTVMTMDQLIQYRYTGFIQLDLFPEELEQAKHEQYAIDWYSLVNLEEEKQQ